MARSKTPADPLPTIRNALYPIGTEMVAVEEVYHVRDVNPPGPGPWNNEADKIAWRDASTGLACIIRRELEGGHLAGYVAVEPGHPLHGFEASTMIALGISAHGELTYSKPCEVRTPSRPPIPHHRAICHVADPNLMQRVRDGLERRRAEHEDGRRAWWFGFTCNLPLDQRPRDRLSGDDPATRIGIERVYRTEAYVYAHVVDLAAALHAIGEGRPIPQRLAPKPPLAGLGPYGPKVFP